MGLCIVLSLARVGPGMEHPDFTRRTPWSGILLWVPPLDVVPQLSLGSP